MTVPELEAELREAHALVSKTMPTDPRTGAVRITNFEDFREARAAFLQAERNLAAAKGEAHAVPIQFPVTWDTGAPLPYLLQNDYRTFLAFLVRNVDPDWDGSYVSARDPGSSATEKLALVEFERCSCTKMGSPNDEVLHGHPLSGKGLEGYRAMLVKNSPWPKEIEAINSVHSRYKSENWRDQNHYILPFHDCTFECIARGFKVEVFDTSLSQLLAEICNRLVR